MRIYYDHTFPESWVPGVLNRLVIQEFARELPNDDFLILDCAGNDRHAIEHYDYDYNAKYKIATSFVDPMRLCHNHAQTYLGDFVTVSMDTYRDYTFWGHFAYNQFQSYYKQEFPLKFENLFLFYNRRPRPHRVKLYKKLIDTDLLKYGIATMGTFEKQKQTLEYDYIIQSINENSTIQDSNTGGHYPGIPNDIVSLGDINVWESSFVNIISETTDGEMFLSEKTFKPIIGKRPFLMNGPPGSLRLLKKWGFRTFSDFWDEDYNDYGHKNNIDHSHNMIVDIIQNLSKMTDKEILDMYSKMQDILDYNHNHFFTSFNDNNKKALRTMGKRYMGLTGYKCTV